MKHENKLGETGASERSRIIFARSVDRQSRFCSPARLSREGLLTVYLNHAKTFLTHYMLNSAKADTANIKTSVPLDILFF